MSTRRRFIADQFDGAAEELARNHLAASLGIATRGATLTAHHAATAQLTDQFLVALAASLPLCDHVAAPSRLVWAPGMSSIGCMIDLVAYAAIENRNVTCDLCGLPQRKAGGIALKAAIAPAGPVAVLAFLCDACRTAKTPIPRDLERVRRQVLREVAKRFSDRGAAKS